MVNEQRSAYNIMLTMNRSTSRKVFMTEYRRIRVWVRERVRMVEIQAIADVMNDGSASYDEHAQNCRYTRDYPESE